MNSLPLVSIAIPAFNPRFFERTLNSAVSQTYSNLDIVVCDDSRGDEIKDIVSPVMEQTGAQCATFAIHRRWGWWAT